MKLPSQVSSRELPGVGYEEGTDWSTRLGSAASKRATGRASTLPVPVIFFVYLEHGSGLGKACPFGPKTTRKKDILSIYLTFH